MTNPLVSVIIPTYNCAALLPRAIDSALAQTAIRVEVIVVDDGSTDETPRVLSRFADRVVALRQPNAGPSAARNLGLRATRGTLVGFLDADDTYHPEKLARQAAALAEHPGCGWVYSDSWLEEEGTGRRLLASERFNYATRLAMEGWLFESLLPGNFIPIHTILVRRSCLDAAGPFDDRFRGIEDFDLLLRLSAVSPATYIPEPLATYFLRPGTLSRDRARVDRDKYLILDKVARLYPERMRGLGRVARRALADMHNWFGYRHAERGEWKDAAARLWASLWLRPLQGRATWGLIRALFHGGLRTKTRAGGASHPPDCGSDLARADIEAQGPIIPGDQREAPRHRGPHL